MTMCPKSKRRIGSLDPTANAAASAADLDYMLLAAVVGGGVGAALLINPVTKIIFKKDAPDAKGVKPSEKWAPAIKIAGGLACLLASENEYINAAGLGMIAVGGVEALQALQPDIFKPGIKANRPATTEPMEGIGETIDLNNWAVASPYDGSVASPYDGSVAGATL